jgi:hypothetical protein
MDLAALRARYDALPSRARLADHLPDEVSIASARWGRVVLTRWALVALDLDNLFSGRWRAPAIRDAILRALDAAAATSTNDAAHLEVVVELGGVGGRVRLVATASPDGVTLTAE